MRSLVALSLFLALSGAAMIASPGAAQAQSNCRQNCMDEENACLARTGNKGQCGNRSNACMTKCR